jgi:hypothetical protein
VRAVQTDLEQNHGRKLAHATYPRRQVEAKRAQWQHAHCQQLKHDPAAVDGLIGERCPK